MLVRKLLVKTVLVRSQIEMRNIFWTMEESHPWYNMAKNLAELCSSVLWKVELSSNKSEYFAKLISK